MQKYQDYIHQTTPCTNPDAKVYWEKKGFPIARVVAAADKCDLVDDRKYSLQTLFDVINFSTGFLVGYAGYALIDKAKSKGRKK